MELIGKQGLARLGLPRWLGICNWQQQGLFSDTALTAYLLTLKGYVPGRPRAISEASGRIAKDHVRLKEFDSKVAAAIPIGDAVRWLLMTYPGVGLGTLLRLYGRMHSGRFGVVNFGERPRITPLAG